MSLELHCLEAGEAQADQLPLVILHGLLGSADNWRSALKHLGSERQVIALDLRNHGRSPHAVGMDYPSMADDVVHTLAQKGIERFQLVGHSMGGKVAMNLALRYPARVERLIVVDIAPLSYHHGHSDEFNAMKAVAAAGVKSRREADDIMSHYLADTSTRQFIATNLVRQPDGQLGWRVGLDNIVNGYSGIAAHPALAGTYPGPTLLIRGSRSPYVNEDGIAAAKALFPDLQVVTLDAGHWVHAECFDDFKAALDTFLDSARKGGE